MAIYHATVKIVSRNSGRSVVGSAAYRAAEKIKNERDGLVHDFTRKKGVVYSEIMVPANAPSWAKDRKILWNEVEKIETAKDAQLAREIEVSLPCELDREQQKKLLRDYIKDNFTDKGMVADFSVHDKNDNNPHAHVLLTMRPFEQNGSWGKKQKKEYILDKNGNKQYDPKKKTYKCKTVKTTDWDKVETLESWRKSWAEKTNIALESAGHDARIDNRSYKMRGITGKLPTAHLGIYAAAMERKGISTIKGDYNRWVVEENGKIEKLRAEITNLEEYCKKKQHQPVCRTVGELKKLCDELIAQNSKESAVLLEKYQQGKKDEISDEKALLTAIISYYGEDCKKLLDSIKQQELEESELNEKVAEFNRKPKPSIFAFKQQMEQKKEYEHLKKLGDDLAARKEIDDKKYREFSQDMRRPEVKNQIHKIKDDILKGNASKKVELNAMYADYKKLRDNVKSLAEAKRILGTEKSDKVINIPESSKTLNPVDLLKSVAADLTKSQNQGLQVRINLSEHER